MGFRLEGEEVHAVLELGTFWVVTSDAEKTAYSLSIGISRVIQAQHVTVAQSQAKHRWHAVAQSSSDSRDKPLRLRRVANVAGAPYP